MRIYGPVPSRRFGLSLGVDIVPHKTCPLDCIYCQLGETDCLQMEQETFFPIEEIIRDVKAALEEGPRPDVITLAGSGEPTLYSRLGELIDELKKLSSAPVLLITNAVLLTVPEVRAAALKADILAPSLDAGDEATFQKINKPHPDLNFNDIVTALIEVTNAHPKEVRLEVMLIDGINDDRQSIENIATITRQIKCDRIDINTPVRPPVPERGAMPCGEDTLELAKSILGPKATPIAKFEKRNHSKKPTHNFDDLDKNVRETLMRRPCTLHDICDSHHLTEADARNILERLLAAGIIQADNTEQGIYYRTTGKNPTVRKL
ncbi:MAG: radical SAM protein [Deltaproteobacteria bacterium]|nr:radical SAM protein [Deltaproteobacteria bacterium]MBN2673041.1 radical SAM protein [Deltaproteobacteria bacterium]